MSESRSFSSTCTAVVKEVAAANDTVFRPCLSVGVVQSIASLDAKFEAATAASGAACEAIDEMGDLLMCAREQFQRLNSV